MRSRPTSTLRASMSNSGMHPRTGPQHSNIKTLAGIKKATLSRSTVEQVMVENTGPVNRTNGVGTGAMTIMAGSTTMFLRTGSTAQDLGIMAIGPPAPTMTRRFDDKATLRTVNVAVQDMVDAEKKAPVVTAKKDMEDPIRRLSRAPNGYSMGGQLRISLPVSVP